MKRLSTWLSLLAKVFGSRIVDQRTGECVGKAFVVAWGGKVRLLGLRETRPLYPAYQNQERQTFWRRDLVFRSHPEPDFEKVDEDT